MGTSFTQFLGGASGNQSVVLTGNATANTLGAWSLFGSVTDPVNEIVLLFDATNSVVNNTLCNIGIGSSGSQIIVAENIPFLTLLTTPLDWAIRLRVKNIPPNTDIWGQIQSDAGAIAPRFSLGVGQNSERSSTLLQVLGADPGTSGGTSYTTGNGAYGAWTSLGTLVGRAETLFFMGTRAGSALTTVNIGVGASTSQVIVAENVPVLYNQPFIEVPGSYPPGEYWIQGYADGSTLEAAIVFN